MVEQDGQAPHPYSEAALRAREQAGEVEATFTPSVVQIRSVKERVLQHLFDSPGSSTEGMEERWTRPLLPQATLAELLESVVDGLIADGVVHYEIHGDGVLEILTLTREPADRIGAIRQKQLQSRIQSFRNPQS